MEDSSLTKIAQWSMLVPLHSIELRGVRTHNLQEVDLDLPHGRLIVFCGVSGSGKTSLALDTLYAEGQRRFIESFSAYTRQFLERLEKPDADRIDGLPPAVAVAARDVSRSSRATIATTTEVYDNLRLLFARIGRVMCHGCGQEVRRDTAASVTDDLVDLPDGTRFMLAFERPLHEQVALETVRRQLLEDGFGRAILDGRSVRLADEPLAAEAAESVLVVVDRLAAGQV
ncbi:MAG: hypothetical protein KDA41_09105, partial [Planctomycetales bacterium]|nr:hypothetical protein [Planctomycetales bacterium]